MNVISQILQRRSVGRTTCVAMPINDHGADAFTTLDRVVHAQGLQQLGDGWLAISAADAHAIVTSLLHHDLALQHELMPFARASDLATQFFDLAPEPHEYFTNGDWTVAGDSEPATLTSWDPISDAAFDSGVVCLGDGVAAVFWVEDED
jgi:hypothetical protein